VASHCASLTLEKHHMGDPAALGTVTADKFIVAVHGTAEEIRAKAILHTSSPTRVDTHGASGTIGTSSDVAASKVASTLFQSRQRNSEMAMDDNAAYRIRYRAYELWAQSGRPNATSLTFWDAAEAELGGVHGPTKIVQANRAQTGTQGELMRTQLGSEPLMVSASGDG
jgi:hypothetical protein